MTQGKGPSHPGSSLRDEDLCLSKPQIEEMCRTYWNFGLQHLSLVGVAWDDADVKSQQQVRARMNAAVKTGGLNPPLLRLREALESLLNIAPDKLTCGYNCEAEYDAAHCEAYTRAIEVARSALAALPTLKSAEADKAEFSQSDMRFGIGMVLETIATKFEAWDTLDMWRSDAASLVRSYKHAAPPTQKQDQAGTAGEASAVSVVEALELARDYFVPRAKYVRGDPKWKNREHRILDRIEDALSASSPPAGTAGGEI